MKQTIEKNVVSITVWTAVTVILWVISMVWVVSDFKAEMIKTNAEFNTRIVVIENNVETQKNYLYNFKSDIKKDLDKNNTKLDNIINILIKK